MFWDQYYFILVLPAVLLSMWAQSRVTDTYRRYRTVRSRSGYTGAQIARRILDAHGLTDVYIEPIGGELTDHYDPRDRVVRLSRDVFYGDNVAALGIAAHETGHAVQHAEGYFPLQLRTAVIPLTNIGAKLSMPLLFLGLILGMPGLVNFGILLFSTVTLFQLITLPVEFNASTRAIDTLADGVLTDDELDGTRRVLTAAALTYVAALLVSAMQLLRLVLLFANQRDRR